ncbi:MAG: GerW family sporulation protein [Blautia faecis]
MQNGTTKLVNVKNQDGLTKVLDMVPDSCATASHPGGDNSAEETVDPASDTL